MPSADILTLADAVVTALNAHSFGTAFTAERGYVPIVELPDMDTLHVTVLPRQDEAELDTRTTLQHGWQIDIAVQQRPTAVTNTYLDPLVYLAQQIAEYFAFGQRPHNSTLTATQVRILYLQEHLQKFRQFTSVITLTFRGWTQP